MPGFKNLRSFVNNAYENGQNSYTSFFKTMEFGVPTGRTWIPLTQEYGAPRAIRYGGPSLEALPCRSDEGLYVGPNVSPAQKYIHKVGFGCNGWNTLPILWELYDFLLIYPTLNFVDIDPQYLINTITLPRYTTGDGVRIIIISGAGYTGGHTMFIQYTNSNGVSDRVTSITSDYLNAAGSVFYATAGYSGCFVPLCPGDTGVRRVDAVWNSSNWGNYGILILAKPIISFYVTDDRYRETDYLMNHPSLPRIYDGASLEFLAFRGSTGNYPATYMGELHIVWN